MSEFDIINETKYFSAEETLTFSLSPRKAFPDVDKEMQFHKNIKRAFIHNITQNEFDKLINEYGSEFETVYFFKIPKVNDLSELTNAPALEEFYLPQTNGLTRYTVKSLEPLKNCRNLKRVFIDCRSENKDFDPKDFDFLEIFNYRIDNTNNFSY